MSFETLVIERLSSITNKLNEIQVNAKRTEEFPEQELLVPTSKIRVSKGGVSEWLEIQKLIDTIALIVKDNGVVIWSARTYEKRMVVIYEDELYLLANHINLPFQSSDFTTELNQGDWIKLTGLAVKKIDVPYPNIMDNSGTIIEDYLSNINPRFQIKKNEILSVTYYEFDTGYGDITPTRSQSTYVLPVGFYGLNGLNVTADYQIGYSKITTKSRDVKLSNEYPSFGIKKTDGLPISGGSAIFQSQEIFDDAVADIITRNIFPEFKFSWGFHERKFKKHFTDNPHSYAGNINLLECNLIEGLPLMMNFKPQILLYRYKSKKHVYCGLQNGNGIMFIKKAKFYHFKPTDERHTVIDVTDRKTILDFGLEHFFDRKTTGEVWANGMKNSQANSLYRKKGKSEAHFYIHLRVKYTINGQEYISDPSNVLRVYYDRNSGKISYENT